MKVIFASLASALLLLVAESAAMTAKVSLSSHLKQRDDEQSADDESTTPVLKVLEMIGDLKKKILEEEHLQWTMYDTSTKRCDKKLKATSWAIKKDGRHKSEDDAVIESTTAIIDGRFSKVKALQYRLDMMNGDLTKLHKVREKERETFLALAKSCNDLIFLIERTIDVLERSRYKGELIQMKGTANLIEALDVMANASMVSTASPRELTALLQSSLASTNKDKDKDDDDDDDDDNALPKKAAYESKLKGTGSIMRTLTNLMEKVQKEVDDARLADLTSQKAYELQVQQSERKIKKQEDRLEAEKLFFSEAKEEKADAEGDLVIVKNQLDVDMKSKTEMEKFCLDEKEAFEASSNARKEEMVAVQKAEIAIGDAVGAPTMKRKADLRGNKVQLSFLQEKAEWFSFLQEKFEAASDSDMYVPHKMDFRAVRYVRKLAEDLHSDKLSMLSMRMANAIRHAARSRGRENPLKRVTKLIHDTIQKLYDEQNAEAAQWAFCNKEIKENEYNMKDKGEKLDKCQTKLDKKEAHLDKLQQTIEDIKEMDKQITKDYIAEKKLRAKRHAIYLETKAGDTKARDGVIAGREILERHYEHNAGTVVDSTDAKDNIIGFLEVIEADIVKNLAELEDIERQQVEDWEDYQQTYRLQKKTNERDIVHLSKEESDTWKDVFELRNEKRSLMSQLKLTNEYLIKMRKQCIVTPPTTHNQRIDKMNAEILGLEKALEILDTETLPAFLQESATTSRTVTGRSLRGVLS